MRKLQEQVQELKYRLAEMEEVFAAVMLPVFLAEYQKKQKSRVR
jgi:hypothetical protein